MSERERETVRERERERESVWREDVCASSEPMWRIGHAMHRLLKNFGRVADSY